MSKLPLLKVLILCDWMPYATELYASIWHRFFPGTDARNTLSWTNRLANFHNTDVYNFFSRVEEVLRTCPDNPPMAILTSLGVELRDYLLGQIPFGTFAWAWQEKGKGTCATDWLIGSTHGGWRFNPAYTNLTVTQASALPDSQLRTNSFFYFRSAINTHPDTALLGTNGAAYAQTNRNRILSDAIPAMTLPVGANVVSSLDHINDPHNFNMQELYENGWPTARSAGQEALKWHHSDFRQVAYTFTYQLFDKLIILGNLQ